MNTTYFVNCALRNIFGIDTSIALPKTYYLGLSKKEPKIDGAGFEEPANGLGYERLLLDKLSEPEDGLVTNSEDINFEESTGNWGTITHFVIFDGKTGGNLLIYGALTTERSVEKATVMTFKKGTLTLSMPTEPCTCV